MLKLKNVSKKRISIFLILEKVREEIKSMAMEKYH